MDPLHPGELTREDQRPAFDSRSGSPAAPETFQPSKLTIDQLRSLREVWLSVADTADVSPVHVMVNRIAEIIEAPVRLVSLDRSGERLDVEASGGPEKAVAARAEILLAARSIDRDAPSVVIPVGEGDLSRLWTCVPIGRRRANPRLLFLPGDWSRWPSIDWLERLARDLSSALRLPGNRSRSRRRVRLLTHARGFTRRLVRATEPALVHGAIVDAFARATRAEQVALAIFDEDDGNLWIAATHGYPHVLVEHVRIAPGVGVIGQVFKSRQPLRVADVSKLGPLYLHRPRYRTPSFIALPLTIGNEAIGVVTVADRSDGNPFDRADVVAASTLMAPAALALARQLLARRAQELEHAVAIEPLTGLFNRRHFSTRIDEEVERARRYSLDLALLLIDIDDFKSLNDTSGHLIGDQILRDTANILRQAVRVFDVCTRFGGDEFAILMPGSTAANALQTADRIRQRVDAHRPAGGAAMFEQRVTISIGVAARKPAASADDMIAAADRALYTAKAEGKNRVKLE